MYVIVFKIDSKFVLKLGENNTIPLYTDIKSIKRLMMPNPDDYGDDREMKMALMGLIEGFVKMSKPVAVEVVGEDCTEVSQFIDEKVKVEIRGNVNIDGVVISEDFLEDRKVIDLKAMVQDEIQRIMDKEKGKPSQKDLDNQVKEILGDDLLEALKKPTFKEMLVDKLSKLKNWLKKN